MNQPFPAGGLGRCKPLAGSGAEPRRQTHFGNNLLKSDLKQVSGSPSTPPKSWCTKRLVFVRSYITKQKIRHSSRRLGYLPSEGPRRSESHTPAQRLPSNCLQCANVSFPSQTNNRTFKSKYQAKVQKHSTLFSILYCVNSSAMQPCLHVSSPS